MFSFNFTFIYFIFSFTGYYTLYTSRQCSELSAAHTVLVGFKRFYLLIVACKNCSLRTVRLKVGRLHIVT